MTTVVEVNDAGGLLLPAERLGDAKPHTRYVVETRDAELVLRPETEHAAPKPKKARRKQALSHEQWKKEWDAWSEEVTKAWNSDKSAADIVSEMRR